jgi:hypothetical protein
MFWQGMIFGIIVGGTMGSLCVYTSKFYDIKVDSRDSIKIIAEDFCGNDDCRRILQETLRHSPYGKE